MEIVKGIGIRIKKIIRFLVYIGLVIGSLYIIPKGVPESAIIWVIILFGGYCWPYLLLGIFIPLFMITLFVNSIEALYTYIVYDWVIVKNKLWLFIKEKCISYREWWTGERV